MRPPKLPLSRETIVQFFANGAPCNEPVMCLGLSLASTSPLKCLQRTEPKSIETMPNASVKTESTEVPAQTLVQAGMHLGHSTKTPMEYLSRAVSGTTWAQVVESMQRLRKDRSFILAEVKGLVLKSTVAQSVGYMNEAHLQTWKVVWDCPKNSEHLCVFWKTWPFDQGPFDSFDQVVGCWTHIQPAHGLVVSGAWYFQWGLGLDNGLRPKCFQ